VLEVGAHGPWRDPECCSDLGVRPAFCDECEYFLLSTRKGLVSVDGQRLLHQEQCGRIDADAPDDQAVRTAIDRKGLAWRGERVTVPPLAVVAEPLGYDRRQPRIWSASA